ncbi:hypothetical protein MMUC44124_15525 [Mycolicibacterium mucogenicum DSM 44124]|nr:hypothetical protein MMUC44124_15525 [Mycolicibacterium mucogenicum DSM 44124]
MVVALVCSLQKLDGSFAMKMVDRQRDSEGARYAL